MPVGGSIVKRPSLGLLPPVVTFSAPQVSLGGAPCAVVRASDSALDFIAPDLLLGPSSSARAHRSGQLFTSGAGARMRRWAVVGPDQRAWIDNRYEYPYDERVWTGAWRFRSGSARPLQAAVTAVELESVLVPPQSGRSACHASARPKRDSHVRAALTVPCRRFSVVVHGLGVAQMRISVNGSEMTLVNSTDRSAHDSVAFEWLESAPLWLEQGGHYPVSVLLLMPYLLGDMQVSEAWPAAES
jgi:hypothetical protein